MRSASACASGISGGIGSPKSNPCTLSTPLMHDARSYLAKAALMPHIFLCRAIASSILPSPARLKSLTADLGMMHAGPAIHPAPPSSNTKSGTWALALNILYLLPYLPLMESRKPVLPEASL